MVVSREVEVRAPGASRVTVCTDSSVVDATPDGTGWWSATVSGEVGARYWLEVDGAGPLLDPSADDVEFVDGWPWSRLRDAWPKEPRLGRHHPDPIVYELHVRHFARTFAGAVDRLDHLVHLGVDVVELMPVHPFDVTSNAWGYMPAVWGAVHRPYAAGDDAAGELAAFVRAAHARDLEVWLDVVLNHTGEGDASMPTWCLRGIDDAHAYLRRADGSYIDDAGCGNVVDPGDAQIRALVLEALDRFADLGIDGFRFDLASILQRDGGELVAEITDWATARDVVLVAEPWDLAAYHVGDQHWPAGWKQWNDRFRDDVRGFLRGEPDLVHNVMRRVQGSPDLFPSGPQRSVNFVTAHDGLTMHDLTIVTSDHHHSWDCGPQLRRQQIRNHFTMLLLAAGTPMFVMGDEFARTQLGHDNPYDVDGPLTWVDWSRLDEWRDLDEFVRTLIRLRRAHPPVGTFTFHGVGPQPDLSPGSRTIAWSCNGLYVAANAFWEPLTFEVHEPGEWDVVLSTAPYGGGPVPARSIVVHRRR